MDEAFDEILLPRTNDPAIDFRVVRLGPKVFREPSDVRRLPMRSDGPLHNTSDYSSRKHIFRLDPAGVVAVRWIRSKILESNP